MNGEAFAIGSDEHELLGLIRLTAPAIAYRCGGEEVVASGDKVVALHFAFESSQERILDGGEIGSVAIPSLSVLFAPDEVRVMLECYGVRRYGPIDRSAFQHDGTTPHSTGDGYQAKPDAGDEASTRSNERGVNEAVLMMGQLASL